jgi:hypothetical protein
MKRPKEASRKAGKIDWHAQLRHDFAWAESALRQNGKFHPMFIIWSPDGIYPVLAPWEEPDRRDAVCALVRCLCIEHDAYAITHIAEAWMRRGNNTLIAPSKASDRIEAVQIVIVYRDDAGERQTLGGARETMRRASGHFDGFRMIKQGGEVMADGQVDMAGRIVDALPDRLAILPEERENARMVREMIQERLGLNVEMIDHPVHRA